MMTVIICGIGMAMIPICGIIAEVVKQNRKLKRIKYLRSLFNV